ncbi:hydrogenase subunit MbhD domain-containing protein [Streptacidiphilus griseoplanus]|uniref:hydrogenase subunit MbhD domain-containing protein n=1 Tax=Peterkaempfera griseoplana TaxID=66896 RepID=UPI00099E7FB9|nr:hydrogenase subunit MbhD domain-containing protein [Peterkaempfera griseoplana]
MTDVLIAVALVFVVAASTGAVLCREPVRQAVVLSALGLGLALLFTLLQAPDVALSQLAVGTALTPLLILLTTRKLRRSTEEAGEDTAPGSAEDTGTPDGGTGSGG